MTQSLLMLGKWGPCVIACARSCSAQGIQFHLAHVGQKSENGKNHSSAVASVLFIDLDIIGTPQGIELIAKHVKAIKATALVAANDDQLVWLAKNRHVFEPHCKVLVQSAESLNQLLSKCYQLEIAQQVGFQVLPTILLIGLEDISKVPDSAFPLVIRPGKSDDVYPSFKVQLIKSREQLYAFMLKLQFVRAPIIAQPFMNVPNLLVHGVRDIDGQILSTKSYLVPRKFEGFALSLEPYPFPKHLQQMCGEFVAKAGVYGCYHFDLLFSPDTQIIYFLEINVRLGGTTDKVMQLGFDEPSLLLQAYHLIPRKPCTTDTIIYNRVVNKRALLKHIFWAARGKLTEMDYPPVSRIKHMLYTLRDLLWTKDSVFNWKDIRGSLWFYLRRS